MFILRTGVDLVEIHRLKDLAPAIRERFIQRVLTEREQAENCDSLESLAGRVAAKEAVAKALGCGIGPLGWRSIEVERAESGAPLLHLHGKAQAEAARLGLQQWSLSISHTREHAVAVAVAIGQDPA